MRCSDLLRILFFVQLLSGLVACDPQHLDKCEWYLVPEMDHKHLVKGQWVPLCARNYTTKKQKCYLKSKIDFAEKVYGKAFIYSSLKLDKSSRPYAVLSLNTCKPEKKKK